MFTRWMQTSKIIHVIRQFKNKNTGKKGFGRYDSSLWSSNIDTVNLKKSCTQEIFLEYICDVRNFLSNCCDLSGQIKFSEVF